tara:strand:+ start:36 stop:1073 length:1038 start_codon:yes stop_codon:yes gene_type:complete
MQPHGFVTGSYFEPNDMDILNSIAGKPRDTGPSPTQRRIKAQNELADKNIKKLENLTPESRYRAIVEDIAPSLDDMEYRWKILEDNYPNGSLEEDTIKEIDQEMLARGTKQEQYFYLQDNFSKWPKKIQDKYREKGRAILEFNPQQDFQDSTILNIANSRAIVQNSLQRMTLQGTQSLDTVVNGLGEAILRGYNQGIGTNEFGQVTVIKDGEAVPIDSLPKETNPASQLEKDVMRGYITEAIKEEVKPYWEKARRETRDNLRLKDRKLFNLLGTEEGKDLKKFAMPIIATAAEHERDKMGMAREGIDKLMKNEIDRYSNPFQYIVGYVQKIDEFQALLEKRYPNG